MIFHIRFAISLSEILIRACYPYYLTLKNLFFFSVLGKKFFLNLENTAKASS